MSNEPTYKILTGGSVIEIERNVHEAFIKGWVPQGGISVLQNSSTNNFTFFQAMVMIQMRAEA